MMRVMREPRYLVLTASALFVAMSGCTPKASRDERPAATTASASSSAAAPIARGTASNGFVSKQHRFSVVFPGGAQPTRQDLGTVMTAIGPLTELSYYAGVGDTAYDVTISLYPKGKLSPDIDGLLKVTRDKALEPPGATLMSEHRMRVKTSRGREVEAHFIEVRIHDAHVFRVTCFFENLGFNISAGGGYGIVRPETFDAFVDSFRLLDDVDDP